MRIIPLPALADNYIWLIQTDDQVIVVDPSEDQPVLTFLVKNRLKPTAILLTHNHNDHTAGVAGIIQHYPSLPVFGPSEVAQFANRLVQDGDRFVLNGHCFEVIKSAGHTAEHISYLVDSEHLFCGDALFSGGCGRVADGNYQAQFETLQRFKSLPNCVQIYAGHEYTVSNLKFAETVLPESCAFAEYQELAAIKRSQKRPTLPSSIGIELQINPFLQAETLADFIRLRQQKDHF